ncbi:MAG: M24 family metallopeptidase C-terminal domain-containing protein, partial [Muribaculaceae bacterium]|nr:M24 family metallopeptidase C-terminal domain-containing protein [Muribaculaceae bacterium]
VEIVFGRFYRFETLTLFPIDLTLYDTSIITDAEIKWVNDYHARCREVLLPRLNPDQAAWLKAKTEPLKR